MGKQFEDSNQTEVSSAAGELSSAESIVEMNRAAGTEVSGYAIARMMGIATTSEVKILEGKLDLISGRVNSVLTKVDRIVAAFQKMPTGSDLERIDVQLGALKTMLRDLTVLMGGEKLEKSAPLSSVSTSSGTQIISSEDPEGESAQ